MSVNLDKFDIVSYLEEEGIEYSTEGKNVSSGWIGISCPFCHGKGLHLGINLTGKGFSCWQCGETGGLPKLIKELEGKSWPEVYRKIREHTGEEVVSYDWAREYQRTPSGRTEVEWPFGTSKKLNNRAASYLWSRRYNPEEVHEKYHLRCCGIEGAFAGRILIPIIMSNKVMSFVGMWYLERKESIPKYRNSSNQKSLIPVKDCIFGIDSVRRNRIILVEGILDAWRIGDECCALLGKNITKTQVEILHQKRLKSAVVLLDQDAQSKAEDLAYTLTTFIPDVRLVLLSEGDPDNLTQDEADQLKYELFGGNQNE